MQLCYCFLPWLESFKDNCNLLTKKIFRVLGLCLCSFLFQILQVFKMASSTSSNFLMFRYFLEVGECLMGLTVFHRCLVKLLEDHQWYYLYHCNNKTTLSHYTLSWSLKKSYHSWSASDPDNLSLSDGWDKLVWVLSRLLMYLSVWSVLKRLMVCGKPDLLETTWCWSMINVIHMLDLLHQSSFFWLS